MIQRCWGGLRHGINCLVLPNTKLSDATNELKITDESLTGAEALLQSVKRRKRRVSLETSASQQSILKLAERSDPIRIFADEAVHVDGGSGLLCDKRADSFKFPFTLSPNQVNV